MSGNGSLLEKTFNVLKRLEATLNDFKRLETTRKGLKRLGEYSNKDVSL
jgi:hypothetical protein